MSKTITLILFVLSVVNYSNLFAQTDSINNLNQIVINGYYQKQNHLRSLNAVALVDSTVLKNYVNESYLTAFNAVAGVRMEERSPGSYRLSLRGSLLRSPFGIRNVKIYLDDFPLTDAGGNSSFNLMATNAFENIAIFKGPNASIYGANTGGAILLTPNAAQENHVQLNSYVGEYGSFIQGLNLSAVHGKIQSNLTASYQTGNGYRAHSALSRKFIQTNHQFSYNAKGQLKLYAFYSDLQYQTPGALTFEELQENAQMARPAKGNLPGAVMQNAGIYNKTLYGGLSHYLQLSKNLKHIIAVFGHYSDFKNPFITNYEQRYERQFGLRSLLDYQWGKGKKQYQLQLGVEHANNPVSVSNYKNNLGVQGSLTTADKLIANQEFGFLRLNADINEKWLLELGASLNHFNYRYQTIYPLLANEQTKKFNMQLMPKVAVSYLLSKNQTVRASLSKGYSPPSIAEVRSSNQIINNYLDAEQGWNYELGYRFNSADKRFQLDFTSYYFMLNDAIARRVDTQDQEYFVNAGGAKQLGFELNNDVWLLKPSTFNLLSSVLWKSSYTVTNYRFSEYFNNQNNYANKLLAGTPQFNSFNSLQIKTKQQVQFLISHQFTSKIPLNDANTVYADTFHLLNFKVNKYFNILTNYKIDVGFGVNNILNEQYSLGNDLNVTNGRYYNTSMPRNVFLNLNLSF